MDSLEAAWYKTEMADNMFKPNPLSAKFQLLSALILAKQNRLADYVQALNKIINKTTDAEVKKAATELLSALNKSSLPQVDLSTDSIAYNAQSSMFVKPDTGEGSLVQKLNEIKEQAKQSGMEVKVDTATQIELVKDTVVKTSISINDTIAKLPQVIVEDTTSPYSRSDAAVHYFIIYIKDPTTPQSSVMSTMAKVDAFNSAQVPERRLTSKQVIIDSKNKLINVRQFKNREDVMSYYNVIKTQNQLFSDLKPEQFAITCISVLNFSVLLSKKDVDEYSKFFTRVYK